MTPSMQMRDRIFRELKFHNHRSVLDLAAMLDEPDEIVRAALDSMALDGYVGVRDDLYYLKYILDRVQPIPGYGFVEYSEILATTCAELPPIPESYMNPDAEFVVHRDQGGQGSCVGQATAYGRDLDLIRLTGQKPEDMDYDRVRRNIDYTPNLWYDIYYRQSMSAEYAYRMSRIVGKVTNPCGSYIPASLKSLKLHGICLHDQWFSPKSGIEAWIGPHPDYAETVSETADETAPKHKIDGYATVDSWDEVCRGIYTHGYVLGTIMVWDNFCSRPSDPCLPEPKGQTCGAHALCFVGYDSNNLYFLHSWWGDRDATVPEWHRVGCISKSYFRHGFMGGYIVLDEEEAEVAFKMYGHVTIRCTTWPDAVLAIADEEIGSLPVSMMLRAGETYCMFLSSCLYNSATSAVVTVPEGCKTITLNPPVTSAMRITAAFRVLRASISRIIDAIRGRAGEKVI